jgi:hypothetical protein
MPTPTPVLLLAHQLPTKPSRARVTTWRRLQRLGAAALQGSVWSLPDSEQAREDFTWMKGEIEAMGGQATIYSATVADRTATLRRRDALAPLDPRRYKRKTWVTRPRPGIDRMASAWLIRRFIDPRARFTFAAQPPDKPSSAVPFDMYGGELSHQGELCTFEVLLKRFRIRDRAATAIGHIVHDVDLHDERHNDPRTATVAVLVDGLRAAHDDDEQLLQHGISMFEALYRSASSEPRRGVATRTQARTRRRR